MRCSTSEDKCAGSKDRTQCILLFLFFLMCNIMFSAGRCKRLNWLGMFKYRVSQRKMEREKKNLHTIINVSIPNLFRNLEINTCDLWPLQSQEGLTVVATGIYVSCELLLGFVTSTHVDGTFMSVTPSVGETSYNRPQSHWLDQRSIYMYRSTDRN